MAEFGLLLVVLVAIVVFVSGLPSYVVLLMAANLGAAAGFMTGAVTIDLLRSLPSRLFNLLENDLLQALPLYILMGALLNRAGIADAIFNSLAALLRRTGKGAELAGVLLGALIGPMNGSVGASTMALASTLGPRLKSAGVPPARSEAIVAMASTFGVVVPPSLVLILLGDAMLMAHTQATNITKQSVRIINTLDLMRGALLPAALLVALVIAATWARRGTERDTGGEARASAAEHAIAFTAIAFLSLLLGGVAVGLFFAVEAAALGAFAIFLAAFARGRLADGHLAAVLRETLSSTGALFAPLLAATTFTLVLRLLQTDKLIEAWVQAIPGGAAVSVIVILLAFALAALALDAFELIFVAVPLLIPPLLVKAPDAVWVGVLLLLVLQASFLLPPLGAATLLARSRLRTGAPLGAFVRELRPYLLMQALVLGLVVSWPGIVHQLDANRGGTQAPPPVRSKEDIEKMFRDIPAPAFPGQGIPGQLPPPRF